MKNSKMEWEEKTTHQKVTGFIVYQVLSLLEKKRIYIEKNKHQKPKPKTIQQKQLSYLISQEEISLEWPWSQHGPANFKPRPYMYSLNEISGYKAASVSLVTIQQ